MYYPNGKEMDQMVRNAMSSHVIAYRSKELLFGTHAFNFNCFLDDLNFISTQIRCLSVLLLRALIFGHIIASTSRPLPSLFKLCPWGQNNLAPGSIGTWPAFYRYLYVSFKQNSGERFRATWPFC